MKAGDLIEVWDSGKWRPAIVASITDATDKYSAGCYMQWDPLPVKDPATSISPSIGGWCPQRHTRPRA